MDGNWTARSTVGGTIAVVLAIGLGVVLAAGGSPAHAALRWATHAPPTPETAVSPTATAEATSPEVRVVDFGFMPATVTVRQHEAVTWRNDGPSDHTVTADDGSFDSGRLAVGDAFANVFDASRTITYHCSIHPAMVGTIVVEAVAATPIESGATPPPGTLPPSFNAVVTPPAGSPFGPTAGAGTAGASPGPAPSDSGSTQLIAALVAGGVALAGAALILSRRQRRG